MSVQLPWFEFSGYNTTNQANVRAFAVNHPQAGRLVVVKGVPESVESDMKSIGFTQTKDGSWAIPAQSMNNQSMLRVFNGVQLKMTALAEIDLTNQFLNQQKPAEAATEEVEEAEEPAEITVEGIIAAQKEAKHAVSEIGTHPLINYLDNNTNIDGDFRSYKGGIPQALSESLWKHLEEHASKTELPSREVVYTLLTKQRAFQISRPPRQPGIQPIVTFYSADELDQLPPIMFKNEPMLFKLTDDFLDKTNISSWHAVEFLGEALGGVEIGEAEDGSLGVNAGSEFMASSTLIHEEAMGIIGSSDAQVNVYNASVDLSKTLVLSNSIHPNLVALEDIQETLGMEAAERIFSDASDILRDGDDLYIEPANLNNEIVLSAAQDKGFTSLVTLKLRADADKITEEEKRDLGSEFFVPNLLVVDSSAINITGTEVARNPARIPEGYSVEAGKGRYKNRIALVNDETKERVSVSLNGSEELTTWFEDEYKAVEAFPAYQDMLAEKQRIADQKAGIVDAIKAGEEISAAEMELISESSEPELSARAANKFLKELFTIETADAKAIVKAAESHISDAKTVYTAESLIAGAQSIYAKPSVEEEAEIDQDPTQEELDRMAAIQVIEQGEYVDDVILNPLIKDAPESLTASESLSFLNETLSVNDVRALQMLEQAEPVEKGDNEIYSPASVLQGAFDVYHQEFLEKNPELKIELSKEPNNKPWNPVDNSEDPAEKPEFKQEIIELDASMSVADVIKAFTDGHVVRDQFENRYWIHDTETAGYVFRSKSKGAIHIVEHGGNPIVGGYSAGEAAQEAFDDISPYLAELQDNLELDKAEKALESAIAEATKPENDEEIEESDPVLSLSVELDSQNNLFAYGTAVSSVKEQVEALGGTYVPSKDALRIPKKVKGEARELFKKLSEEQGFELYNYSQSRIKIKVGSQFEQDGQRFKISEILNRSLINHDEPVPYVTINRVADDEKLITVNNHIPLKDLGNEYDLDVVNMDDVIEQLNKYRSPKPEEAQAEETPANEPEAQENRPTLSVVESTPPENNDEAPAKKESLYAYLGDVWEQIGENSNGDKLFTNRHQCRMSVSADGTHKVEPHIYLGNRDFTAPEKRDNAFLTIKESNSTVSTDENVVSLFAEKESENDMTLDDLLNDIGIDRAILASAVYAQTRLFNEGVDGADPFTLKRLTETRDKELATLQQNMQEKGRTIDVAGLENLSVKIAEIVTPSEERISLAKEMNELAKNGITRKEAFDSEYMSALEPEKAKMIHPERLSELFNQYNNVGRSDLEAVLLTKIYGTSEEQEEAINVLNQELPTEDSDKIRDELQAKYQETRLLAETPSLIEFTQLQIEGETSISPIPNQYRNQRIDDLLMNYSRVVYKTDDVEITDEKVEQFRVAPDMTSFYKELGEQLNASYEAGKLVGMRVEDEANNRRLREIEKTDTYIATKAAIEGIAENPIDPRTQLVSSVSPENFYDKAASIATGAGTVSISFIEEIPEHQSYSKGSYKASLHYNPEETHGKSEGARLYYAELPTPEQIRTDIEAFASRFITDISAHTSPAYGSLYDSLGKEQYNNTLIAKNIREGVKQAIKDGELPKGVKVGVKKSSGNGIGLTLKEIPESFKLYTKEYADWYADQQARNWPHDNDRPDTKYTMEGLALKAKLERILDAYNFDKSDSMSDYYHVNYYSDFYVDSDLEDLARESALKEPDLNDLHEKMIAAAYPTLGETPKGYFWDAVGEGFYSDDASRSVKPHYTTYPTNFDLIVSNNGEITRLEGGIAEQYQRAAELTNWVHTGEESYLNRALGDIKAPAQEEADEVTLVSADISRNDVVKELDYFNDFFLACHEMVNGNYKRVEAEFVDKSRNKMKLVSDLETITVSISNFPQPTLVLDRTSVKRHPEVDVNEVMASLDDYLVSGRVNKIGRASCRERVYAPV